MGKRGPAANTEIRAAALALRLEGHPFSVIGKTLGLSRQRIQQMLSPPKEIRDQVVEAADGACTRCGLYVGPSGHVHHRRARDVEIDDYNDVANLRLLCASCHRRSHGFMDRLSAEHIDRVIAEARERTANDLAERRSPRTAPPAEGGSDG